VAKDGQVNRPPPPPPHAGMYDGGGGMAATPREKTAAGGNRIGTGHGGSDTLAPETTPKPGFYKVCFLFCRERRPS